MADIVLLTHALLIDGTGREPRKDATVVVEGHLIIPSGPHGCSAAVFDRPAIVHRQDGAGHGARGVGRQPQHCLSHVGEIELAAPVKQVFFTGLEIKLLITLVQIAL
jgi:hypothetical protein